MVSTRPSPAPAGGRVAYPSATTYTPGDADASPSYLAPPPATTSAEPMRRMSSRDSEREKVQGLRTWWKGFREREKVRNGGVEPGMGGGASGGGGGGGGARDPKAVGGLMGTRRRAEGRGVFGIPLNESIEYAAVQISTAGDDGSLYVWGTIPVVVAKCGRYLKENATEVEGTFRISGSAKRMRELQAVFDTPPKYGKNIDWKSLGFNSHDVATIFRRFLTQMPEPIIPFDYYEDFRQTLSTEAPEEETVERYKLLIRSLPPLNQYLLLYVLDLLSVFAKKADKNLMTGPNLALIFQPGVLSHPIHAMRPRDHVLSQQVLEFLIEHQDNFLLGMQLSQPKKKKRKGSSIAGSAAAPASPPPSSPVPPPRPLSPQPEVVDADFIIPSDSDDEPPTGGYLIYEGTANARQLALDEAKRNAAAAAPPSPPQSPSSSHLPSIDATLIPARPVKSAPAASQSASASYGAKGATTVSSPPVRPTQTIMETMEPSDSDEDVPSGGYEVHVSDPAKNRAALLARAKTRVEPPSSRRQVVTAEMLAGPPGTGLVRRKTVPNKRVADWVSRRRSGAKEI